MLIDDVDDDRLGVSIGIAWGVRCWSVSLWMVGCGVVCRVVLRRLSGIVQCERTDFFAGGFGRTI